VKVLWNWLIQVQERGVQRHPQSPSSALGYAIVMVAVYGATVTLWFLIALMDDDALIWSGWAVFLAMFVMFTLLLVQRYRYVKRTSISSSQVARGPART
jgi:hypothetical protein